MPVSSSAVVVLGWPPHCATAVGLAIGAGVLQGSFVVPLKMQRKWLRKRALWEFENNFIIHSLIALLVFPVVAGLGANVLNVGNSVTFL